MSETAWPSHREKTVPNRNRHPEERITDRILFLRSKYGIDSQSDTPIGAKFDNHFKRLQRIYPNSQFRVIDHKQQIVQQRTALKLVGERWVSVPDVEANQLLTTSKAEGIDLSLL